MLGRLEESPFHSGFGRYRLVRRIAAGGMGEVYRAVATGLGDVEKPVAIKLLKPDLAKEPDFVKMFEEEAKVSFLLTHGNVVQTFDVGRIDDRYFIAMELVRGMTLAALLDRCRKTLGQPLPFRHALYVASEALRGLDYAHRAKDGNGRPLGIVHRDVSPTNLFVSEEGEVKVGDFGIALSSLRSSRSRAGTVKGKLSYMAPEQLRAEAVDPRADVYAMGAVLYETLTMRAPFVGGGMELIPLVLDGVFPRPRERVPEIPEPLEKLVLDAMAPKREERIASAHEFRDRIERLALSMGWSLSSGAFAEFVRKLSDDPEDTGSLPVGDPFAAELRRVAGGGGQLSVFTSLADAKLRPSSTEELPAGFKPDLGPALPEVTADVGPPPRRARRAAIASIAAGLLLLGGAAFLALAGDGEEGAVTTARPAMAAPPPVTRVPTAAPVTVLPATLAPATAAVVTARPPAPRGTATLTISTDPWSSVTLDGRPLGVTPIIGREVPAGRHRLRLEHPPLGLSKDLVVVLEPGETKTIRERLTP
jgi:serine/threonine-protein kinase